MNQLRFIVVLMGIRLAETTSLTSEKVTDVRKRWNLLQDGGEGVHLILRNGALESVLALMGYWKRFSGVLFVDDSLGSTLEFVKMFLKTYLTDGFEIVSVKINDGENLKLQLKLLSENYQNIVTISSSPATEEIISQAFNLSLLKSNHTWILVCHTLPHFKPEVQIPPNTQVTAAVVDATKEDDNSTFANSLTVQFYDMFYSYKTNKIDGVKFANWSVHRGLFIFEDPESDVNEDKLRGRMFRSVAFQSLPYTRVNKINGSAIVSGYTHEVLRTIVEEDLKANMKDIRIIEPGWGSWENGSWTGMTGVVFRRETDFGVTNTVMNRFRVKANRLICMVAQIDMSLMYQTPTPFIPKNTHWLPFPAAVWLITIALAGTSAACLAITMLCSPGWRLSDVPSSINHDKTFSLMTWTFFVDALSNPPGASAKVLYFTLVLATLATFAMYNAELFSFLSNRVIEYPVQSMEDLAREKAYWPLFIKSTTHTETIQNANDPILRRVWQRGVTCGNACMSDTPPKAVPMLFKGKYVLLFSRAAPMVLAKNPCHMTEFKTPFMKESTHLTARLDFPYTRMMYMRILRMYGGGLMKRLEEKHHVKVKVNCEQDSSSISFGLLQVLLPFYVLLAGIIASILALLVEYCAARRTDYQLCY